MKLINDTFHRPFPLPSKNWIMRQTWRNLLFIHWPIPSEILRKHIPSSLEIDTFNGSAWLGIIVFLMDGIYPRGLSNLSILPKFQEVNVRTYVKCNGKSGIYFLSLDVCDWASYTIAKRWLRLPYHSSQISIEKKGKNFHFESIRKRNTEITLDGIYTPLEEVYLPNEGTLDHFLTERYCFFSSSNGTHTYCLEIHHQPWKLQKAELEINHNTLFAPLNIDVSEVRPISHYSIGTDSLIWNIKKFK
ncbi:YqjF family protein [Bacillus sp. FJAT-29937]|uniref:YqjF family protein n=1 Tax=Bacillus sp. FJAT-29937 TaxID=1720553 RepID=UPI00082AFF70|nr:DUF2071 domain-containing protein [Bacillus sp. FJAT-29937]